jgi:hypothetical protein
MPTKTPDFITSLTLQTTSTRDDQPPGWFAEFTTLALWFRQSWALIPLDAALRLSRRVDATAAVDVVLVLLAALVAHSSVADTHAQLQPVRTLVPRLWDRAAMPSRPAVSRFLKALDEQALTAMEALFFTPFSSTA